jgi:hypothetical protein
MDRKQPILTAGSNGPPGLAFQVDSNRPYPFLRLSPELRNIIYDYCLVDSDKISVF